MLAIFSSICDTRLLRISSCSIIPLPCSTTLAASETHDLPVLLQLRDELIALSDNVVVSVQHISYT